MLRACAANRILTWFAEHQHFESRALAVRSRSLGDQLLSGAIVAPGHVADASAAGMCHVVSLSS
jgi:hypothetical protein